MDNSVQQQLMKDCGYKHQQTLYPQIPLQERSPDST